MLKADTYYKIDETTPKSRFLLKKVKEHGGVRPLAKKIGINHATLSLALNLKPISKMAMLKIAKFFGKDTIEIF
jgi:hypothetical protein